MLYNSLILQSFTVFRSAVYFFNLLTFNYLNTLQIQFSCNNAIDSKKEILLCHISIFFLFTVIVSVSAFGRRSEAISLLLPPYWKIATSGVPPSSK